VWGRVVTVVGITLKWSIISVTRIYALS
jgi:hypothetical protein